MVIYKITNKINGKAYIEQTVQDVEKRWRNLWEINNEFNTKNNII